jgi:hypothetical protein
MKKHFYSDIVDIESLKIALSEMDLSTKEKSHLLEIVESSVHHVVLDAVLSELSEKDKKIFLAHLISDEHDKIWEMLNEKSENIEEKIKKAAEDLKEQLHKDIKEVKRK